MSRVAKSPINIPDNVEFSMNENMLRSKEAKENLNFLYLNPYLLRCRKMLSMLNMMKLINNL